MNEKLAKQEMLLYIQPPSFVCILRDFAVKIFTLRAIGAVVFEYAKRLKTRF